MKAAAIFDLDGTIIPHASTERLFLRYLLSKKEISLTKWLRCLPQFLRNIGSWDRMVLQNKMFLTGMSAQRLRADAETFFKAECDRLVPAMIQQRIRFHRAQGSLLILLSGADDFILDVFREKLGFDLCQGTELQVVKGVLSGKINGIHPYGQRKAALLGDLAEKHAINLADSFFYANHGSDIEAMSMTGHPVAVYPDPPLRRHALKNQWPVMGG